MLDKSIPYKDLIMKWDGNRQCLLPVCVPPGYRLRTWREGDQKNWARIQKEAGEFGDMTLEQTEAWFLQEYGDRKEELSFRCLFAESMDKEADGVCMAWTEAGTDGSLIPSLHWLAVRDAKKGQGIGTALVREALRVFAGRGEVPVFLHTQPWSYEAVGLYLKAGFFLCRSETFGTHKNQFQEGIRILEQYLDEYPRLCR